uniref:RAD51D N-terminal domain-containing protein n=1 Tax=Moschus moschiferus TaxID=68415 RepID=A0A8C6DKP9_MOSMO
MGVLLARPCPGLIQDMVQLLQSGGIKTVVNLVSADLEKVAQKCAQLSAFPFSGADLYKELTTSTTILSIGIGSLDKLLDAYLYTGEVTGITGGPGSSKTQAGALQRIQVEPAFDIFQRPKQASTSSGTLKVVVADSIPVVLIPLLGGSQRECLALTLQLAQELKAMAQDLSMAVAVTSHLTSDRDSRQLKPALKCSWSFVPSTRLLLDIDQGAGASGCRRLACLTTSPRLPTGFQERVNTGTCGAPEQSLALQGDHT